MTCATPTVVLVNPPGKSVYLRDYFCSKVSQADYVNHPIDFVYLSGWLRDTCQVHLVDAIVEELDIESCLAGIARLQPHTVIGLIGSASYQEDVAFYRQLAERMDVTLVLMGDVLIEDRARRLQSFTFADAFLHDFSTPDLLHYLSGNGHSVVNMTIRSATGIEATPISRTSGRLDLPEPDHSLFLNRNYRYPFVRKKRFASVLTEYGCPYRCNFCIMSTLGWKERPVGQVLSELKQIRRLGISEIFFLDQTFGARQERARSLLKGMEPLGLGWVCFSRPDRLDDAILTRMRRAGCHSLILGLESGSQAILDATQKETTLEQVAKGFELSERHGLRRIATVILGLPEETLETFQATMSFLKEVRPDFVSFNVAVPRMGTPLRHKAIRTGLIDSSFQSMDQSGQPVAMPSLHLSRAEVEALRRRAVREFYLNVRYLGRRVKSALQSGSWEETSIQLRQGLGVLKNTLGGATAPGPSPPPAAPHKNPLKSQPENAP